MTLEQFNAAFKSCKAKDFNFDNEEVTNIFKYVTKARNTTGVKINIDQMT